MTAKRLDGYVRVSRTNGREGDSYISPTVQREKIEQWAALHDAELGEVVVEEDVSGVKRLDDRKLGMLVRRCEEGESEGIVVYRLDRFSRSPRDTFEALDRLEKAGARLVGVADGVDSSAPSGELVVGVLAGIAREQWKQRRDNWAEATGRAVADGVHVSSRPPTGYEREGRRARLERDPEVAPLVREVFLRRAKGESWLSLSKFLTESGVPISKTGVGGIVRNRAYLGEARGARKGECTPGAHEALVTPEEFNAAQIEGRAHAKDGTIAAKGMLSGLITCAGCGRKLSVTGSRNAKTGERDPVYFCKTHFSAGDCPSPAAARADRVDACVAAALTDAILDGTLSATMDAVSRYRQARSAVEKAEQDLDSKPDVPTQARAKHPSLSLPEGPSERGVTGFLGVRLDRANVERAISAMGVKEPVSIKWEDFSGTTNGDGQIIGGDHRFHRGRHEIRLHASLDAEAVARRLVHELRHAAQHEEGFEADGSDVPYRRRCQEVDAERTVERWTGVFCRGADARGRLFPARHELAR